MSLDSLVFAASARLAQAFCSLIDSDVGLDDDDHEVLLDQIDAAGSHNASLTYVLHPEWRSLHDSAVMEKVAELLERHGGETDAEPIVLLADAFDRCVEGVRAVPRRGMRVVKRELEFAASHIDTAMYLLDPVGWGGNVDGTTPEERVRLASVIELIELEIEQNREVVRRRGRYTSYTRQV
jgi:hypothetical protein